MQRYILCGFFVESQRLIFMWIESLDMLSQYCSEFLVHAADVEGLCQGIDEELVQSTSQPILRPLLYFYMPT